MATVIPTLSNKTDADGVSQIYLRITISRTLRFRIKSGLYISPKRFRDGKITFPRNNPIEAEGLRVVEKGLGKLTEFILDLCRETDPSKLTREYIDEAVDRWRDPEKYTSTATDSSQFFNHWDNFISTHTRLSEWRLKRYAVLRRSLARFEAYKRLSSPNYALNVETFDAAAIVEYEAFLRDETKVYAEHPELYISFPIDGRSARKSRAPEPRGDNTIVTTLSCLRAFFRWCMKQPGINILHHPFENFEGTTREKYGKPYFITIEERDKIAELDLSELPNLAVQRDIFIFHCFVGCRVSDLIRLNGGNISDGMLYYIPHKTRGERVDAVSVPLHPRAAALIEKYKGIDKRGLLFPFITPQRYNDAIKKIFTIAQITRPVTVINPTTGQEEQRPINEIASSHICRRTFIGNLYRAVKDPNIIGKMSGHTEGSKAFARYRDIDDDIKRDVINLLG